MKKTRLLAVLTLPLLLAAAAGKSKWRAAVATAVSPESAYGLCRAIAAEPFAGRLTGDEGYTRAAKWAAARFASWGLESLPGLNRFLQPYPSPCTLVDGAEMSVFLPAPQSADPAPAPPGHKLQLLKEFLPLLYSGSGRRRGGVVFAGWGISAPELGYDDYAGIDVAGRFVLCFRGTPHDDPRWEPFDEHRARMKTARDRGAAGLVYIYPEPQANPNGDWLGEFLAAEISEPAADQLLAERGVRAGELKQHLRRYGRPLSFALRAELELDVRARHLPSALGYNVAGVVPGGDPQLKGEFVVLGAHFDHCGRHFGITFPGANDNGSGSAAVMEMARVAARLPRRPKRSLLFVLFGGEEKGLEGSRHFATHPPAAVRRISAMFNFDMVGEGDRVGAGVSEKPEELLAALRRAEAALAPLAGVRVIRHVGVRSSDFAPFFLQGIPCLSFWSNGPHLAYHQPGDTIYRINPEVLADTARIALLTALEWADR